MKDMKKTLLKIGVPVVLAAGCISSIYFFNTKSYTISDNTVVVCEDASSLNVTDSKPLQIVQRQKTENINGLHEIYVFNDNIEVFVGIGLTRKEFEEKYKDKHLVDMTNEEINQAENDIYGKVYRLNLSTLEKTPLKNGKEIINEVTTGISPDRTKFVYMLNGKQYIYDIKNDTNTAFFDKKYSGSWSKDSNFIINGTFGFGVSKDALYVYDVKEKITKKIELKGDDVDLSSIPSFYSDNGREIYFIGAQSAQGSIRRSVIFKVNTETEKAEPVMILPYTDHSKPGTDESYNGLLSNDYNIIDGGKKIIFVGILKGEDGIFIYDIESDKYNKVVSATEDGASVCYWISPDKSKLIYATPEDKGDKRYWNMYAAKINGNELVNRICLSKCVDLGGSIPNMVHWSTDSKKIVFFEENSVHNKNGFDLSDKNIINVITFK